MKRNLLLYALLIQTSSVVSTPNAHAGARRCTITHLNTHERQQLQAAIQRALPANVRAEGIPDVCGYQGSIDTWQDTWPHLRPDGVTEWWSITCSRTREWACEPPKHRQLIWVYAEIGGILRRLEIQFDEATSPDRARRFATQALQIIQDTSSAAIPGCGDSLTDKGIKDWRELQFQYALKPEDRSAEISVETGENGEVDIQTQGNNTGLVLRFTDESSEPIGGSYPCWLFWVIVA